jgi:hypothetical protein
MLALRIQEENMPAELRNEITALNDQDALVAGRSLVVLLDLKLKDEPKASRPANANPAALDSVVETSGPAVTELRSNLAKAGDVEAAAAARGLLMMCAEMGYEDEVRQACQAADRHVRDMGVLTGPLIVAALAAVVAWVPVERKKKVQKQTVITPDGTTITTEEASEEVHRVGSAALEALQGWWQAIVPT